MFDTIILERIDKQRDRLQMGEFFFLLHTLTQVAKITDLEQAEDMLQKAELRVQYLQPKQERVLKSVAMNKVVYMKKIGIEFKRDTELLMADWSLYEVLKELVSCVRGNHMIRKSIHRGTRLVDCVNAVLQPKEKHSLKVTVNQ